MDIAKGVEFLHDKPVVLHRDLKPLNIVLDENWNAKICDFGLARTMTMSETHVIITRPAGTPIYMAPESFDKTNKITEKADIWALGCVINELFGGGTPYPRCNVPQIIKKLNNKEGPRIADAPPNVKAIIQSCLCFDVRERATATQVVKALLKVRTPDTEAQALKMEEAAKLKGQEALRAERTGKVINYGCGYYRGEVMDGEEHGLGVQR
eukprot:GHVU01030384.1.p2 GENE.GHVU01030384.1~~GHVU01030384.1.p2  ORF type:complete len:227 (+),score=39.26 GHVU01030384.1:52-681(+)